VGQFYFKNPLDCELNSLEIFSSQKNFSFSKKQTVIAFTEKHFDLEDFNCFIDYCFNFLIYLLNLINLLGSHLNE
jgi:hypothetical protein